MEVEDCKRRMEMLAKDCEIYKKQRDCALDARKEAIVERDQAISEKDTIRTQYIELQTKRDQINEERATLIQDYDALEIRYKATLDELSCVKRELNEKELEAGDLSRLLNEAREKVCHTSHFFHLQSVSKSILNDKYSLDFYVAQTIVFTRISAAALVKFYDFLMRRLVKLTERNDSG